MRHTNYTLSPTRINNAKPQAKPYKLTDLNYFSIASNSTSNVSVALGGTTPPAPRLP